MQRIHDLIADQDASAVAIFDHNGSVFTYGDLRIAVDLAADTLRSHGVRAGDRVVVLAENCATYAVAVLALSLLDAWIVPLNARASGRELETVLSHSRARCLIATTDVSEDAKTHAKRLNAASIRALPCGDLVVSPLRDVEAEPVLQNDTQVAAILYTTGTSGVPKGVMLTHKNLLFMASASATVRQASAKDQALVALPATHIFGFSSIVLTTLFAGGSLRFQPRFDPEQVIHAAQSGATMFSGVPQMFAHILKYCGQNGLKRIETSLRYMSSGGSPLDPGWKRRIEEIFGCAVQNGYGMTEASPGIAVTRIEDVTRDDSVGHALEGVDVRLDRPGADGVGELLVRGNNVMKGYYRDPEATAFVFSSDGYLRTGDLARIDCSGSIYIVGRCKELIIHSGFNVYPPEIETALNAHPAVTQAAVIGRPRDGNEDVLAFVTLNSDATETDLKDHLRQMLVNYKVPLHIVIAKDLPEAATGKILKSDLLRYFAAEITTLDAQAGVVG